MTLRKRAEEAAKVAMAKWDEDSDGTPQGFRKHIADAIEAEAKRFAEKSCEKLYNFLADALPAVDFDGPEFEESACVAEAIAAAAEGEAE